MTTLTRRNYGRGHTYAVDGKKAPGVTTILRMRANEAFVTSAAQKTAYYAVDHWGELSEKPISVRLERMAAARWQSLEAAALRGTKLHAYAERLHRDEEIPADELDDEQSALVDSYVTFLDRTGLHVVAAEMVVGNRAPLYCGTADLVADLPALRYGDTEIPPSRWLLDLKTALKGVFPDSALQTTAYRMAKFYLRPDGTTGLTEELGIERCGAVHVRQDGWALYPLESGPMVWDTFRHYAWLFHNADDQTAKTWLGSAIDPPSIAPALITTASQF